MTLPCISARTESAVRHSPGYPAVARRSAQEHGIGRLQQLAELGADSHAAVGLRRGRIGFELLVEGAPLVFSAPGLAHARGRYGGPPAMAGKSDVPSDFSSESMYSTRPPPAPLARTADAATPEGVAAFLRDLKGHTRTVDLARYSASSRFAIARWLNGTAERSRPRLQNASASAARTRSASIALLHESGQIELHDGRRRPRSVLMLDTRRDPDARAGFALGGYEWRHGASKRNAGPLLQSVRGVAGRSRPHPAASEGLPERAPDHRRSVRTRGARLLAADLLLDLAEGPEGKS